MPGRLLNALCVVAAVDEAVVDLVAVDQQVMPLRDLGDRRQLVV